MSKLPNFIFSRDSVAEKQSGFRLFGVLLTDIPKGKGKPKIKNRDERLIKYIISRLVEAVEANPSMTTAGIWRTGKIPADAVSLPYPENLIRARRECCLSIIVSSSSADGPEDEIALDGELACRLGLIPVH